MFSPIEGLGVRLRSGDRWSYGAFIGAGFDKRRMTDSIQPELKLNAIYDLGTWDAGFSVKQRLGNTENRGLSWEGDLRYTLWETPIFDCAHPWWLHGWTKPMVEIFLGRARA